ncbi:MULTISPECIES: GntR family transcriptional regulator [Kocuria]|uniref:GntR family transcriptional regulator n=1 Tax=Kocuria oceani TaxID=988827 RepID=A0ABV9TIX1_9MICC|nr:MULTISPECIES: GntR family transcriptional regulator [Kocuria]KLU10170.1 GntR family transcriptional regulator [Kocuria sp. SM24M-10]OLT07462.1 GntR family transcriptional regulator [Kocuria sp. CNJ-770]
MRASDRAYEALREDIVEWRLLPGQVLGEVEQSERFGISRTPIREALSRLTADGLAEAHRGRGVVVSQVSLEDVRALFELREALDCRAARLAARRRDPAEFQRLATELERCVDRLHGPSTDDRSAYYELVERMDRAVDDATANPYLTAAQRSLRLHLARVRKLSRTNPSRLARAAAEHAQIARAIAEGSEELAEAATRVHLANSLHAVLTTPVREWVQPAPPLDAAG